MLISAIGDKLDSRARVVHPKGVSFVRTWGSYFDLGAPFFLIEMNDDFESKYECDL